MHFHLPKPLHGWREFAGEVGIIVVGVLIALGAEQVVETIHWREQVGEARHAMASELGDSIGQSYERQRMFPCIEGRLNEISRLLDAAEKSGRLPPLGETGAPPYRTWVHGTWDTSRQGQTASHFSRVELTNLAAIYEFVDNIDRVALPEQSAWAEIATVSGPGRAIEPAEVAQLRNAVSQARVLNRVTSVAAIRLRQVTEDAHIPFDAQTVKDYTDRPVSQYAICKRIPDKVPEAYDFAPMSSNLTALLQYPLKAWK